MARCFCGCERKVPFSRRLLNRRGRLVTEHLRAVERRLGREVADPAIQQWYAEGDEFAIVLGRYVHEEPLDQSASEPVDITQWQKLGHRLERKHARVQADRGRGLLG